MPAFPTVTTFVSAAGHRPGVWLPLMLAGLGFLRAWGGEAVGHTTDRRWVIHTFSADDLAVAFDTGGTPRLPATPGKVMIGFGPAKGTERPPLRARHRLEGTDETWREAAGEMRLAVRFFADNGDMVGETAFKILGESEGWTGRLETSPFVRRRETVTVPPDAVTFWVVQSSAGPPNAVGVHGLARLVLARDGDRTEPLLRWPGQPGATEDWVRDGLRTTMAKVMFLDGGPVLFLEDDDAESHAEWRSERRALGETEPGGFVMLEWDHAHSIGLAGTASATYAGLPAGYFRFRVQELSVAGLPGAAETSLSFEVPVSAWRTPWFWVAVAAVLVAAGLGAGRLAEWRRLQRRLRALEQHRAVEQERLRIARDIHDDLGARVTEIALLSAVAQRRAALPDAARNDFGEVSRMTRDLVSALYETVWSVSPENDHLGALADYLCQLGNQMCASADLRCRLEMPALPNGVPLTSQARHHVIMAVKEALHNTIKHARAREVRLGVSGRDGNVCLTLRDDGTGFDSATVSQGNGLANLRRRMAAIGGDCRIESRPGHGTTVRLVFPVPEPPETPSPTA